MYAMFPSTYCYHDEDLNLTNNSCGVIMFTHPADKRMTELSL